MKKRLRKKKHIGEFKIYGVPLSIKRNRKTDFDAFFDDFLEEAIMANGCCCGGGGKEDKLDVFIELGREDNRPEVALEKIKSWIRSRSDIDKWYLGQVIDANYGPFDEMDDIAMKI
ncbi:MAG: 50S ribosome-binding protein YggL [Desulfobacteraceae bacterium]|jgi:uncharacterized protein YggL (DUF469 family)